VDSTCEGKSMIPLENVWTSVSFEYMYDGCMLQHF
jgi:hypothetical protein